eukprot:gene56341-43152_t
MTLAVHLQIAAAVAEQRPGSREEGFDFAPPYKTFAEIARDEVFAD